MSPKVFVSYSHKDAAHQSKLAVHLAPLVREGLRVFYDGDIVPGADLNAAIRCELREAAIFVALASPNYLQSEYCFIKEYGYARRRAARKSMFVVAVIIRPCRWRDTRMSRYKSLPADGKPVTLWANRDLAFEDVVDGLRRVIDLACDIKRTDRAQAPAAMKSTSSSGTKLGKTSAGRRRMVSAVPAAANKKRLPAARRNTRPAANAKARSSTSRPSKPRRR